MIIFETITSWADSVTEFELGIIMIVSIAYGFVLGRIWPREGSGNG